jgi:hypothetical protein
MTSFQLVPFDLAPQAQNVLAALLRCQEAFDAAMSEHKRVTVNADEFKRQLDDAETAIGDLKIGALIFFFFSLNFRAQTRKSLIAQRIGTCIQRGERERIAEKSNLSIEARTGRPGAPSAATAGGGRRRSNGSGSACARDGAASQRGAAAAGARQRGCRAAAQARVGAARAAQRESGHGANVSTAAGAGVEATECEEMKPIASTDPFSTFFAFSATLKKKTRKVEFAMAQANAQHQAQAVDDEQQQGGPMPLQRLEVRRIVRFLGVR